MIKLALAKGRILNQLIPVFEQAGIVLEQDPKTTRKLVIDVKNYPLSIMIIRSSDVLTYVKYAAADLGIVGKDMLLEMGGDEVYELYDTRLSQCRLVLAEREKTSPEHAYLKSIQTSKVKVASKYVNISRQFFADKGIQSEIIKLYGSMELAPHVGLCDKIIDLVDTGATLKANKLVELETISSISARLVANKVAYKLKNQQLSPLLNKIIEAVDAYHVSTD